MAVVSAGKGEKKADQSALTSWDVGDRQCLKALQCYKEHDGATSRSEGKCGTIGVLLFH